MNVNNVGLNLREPSLNETVDLRAVQRCHPTQPYAVDVHEITFRECIGLTRELTGHDADAMPQLAERA